MEAWIAGSDGPHIADLETPKVGPGDILVRIRAAGLNRADLSMAAGVPHGGAGGVGNVLGLEWAGEVAEIGADVTGIHPGDRVMGTGGGGYAEYAMTDAGQVSAIPTAMTFEQAATLPVALRTMHDAVMTNGQMRPGQAVLIHGASSGVGLMGLQIAKAMGAGVVIGSSGNPQRRARLAEFGADLAVDASDPAWVEQIKAATAGQGVDLVVDQVSGPGINETMRAMRVLGRIVNVGRLGGMKAEIDMNLHALRRITYVGVTFRSRSKAEVAEIVRRMQADLTPLLEAGTLSLPIDQVFEFADLPAALARMEANDHFGKMVIRT
jgi:NADPH2:quinone reductase